MTRSKAPTVLLHLGQHKTGSKALQAYLTTYQSQLLQQGILYPLEVKPQHRILAYARSQFRFFALLRRAVMLLHGDRTAEGWWQEVARYCQPSQTLWDFAADLETERRRTGANRIVLSAEDLFDMHTAHETGFSFQRVESASQLLAGLFQIFGWDVRVIVYLRRQDHLLAAHYGQFIKGSTVNDTDMDTFAASFAPRLDSHQLLECWKEAFGQQRLVVRPYERAALPGGIVRDFMESCGLPHLDDGRNLPDDAEARNLSLGRDLIEFVRILNRQQQAGREIPSRDLVLETAARLSLDWSGPSGIAAWYSPEQRRNLLARHEEGNTRIAREFLEQVDGRLFREPLPVDPNWKPYRGLQSDRITEITRAISATATNIQARAG